MPCEWTKQRHHRKNAHFLMRKNENCLFQITQPNNFQNKTKSSHSKRSWKHWNIFLNIFLKFWTSLKHLKTIFRKNKQYQNNFKTNQNNFRTILKQYLFFSFYFKTISEQLWKFKTILETIFNNSNNFGHSLGAPEPQHF